VKKVLVDVNVVLDVLLDRQPHVEASAAVWALAESGVIAGLLAAHGVTTIHYLIRKDLGAAKSARVMRTLLDVFAIAAVDEAVLKSALQLSMSDFEDAVAAAAARRAGCDYIVTREPKGFRSSPVPALTPEAVLPLVY
jgi:predicted nucleic acid-binding protein